MFNIINVNASSYYIDDNDSYVLCEKYSQQCVTVDKNTDGLTVNNSLKVITYNNEDYNFDASLQESYYKTLYGQTRMYFYMSGENFVLCKTKSSCTNYSRKRLEDKGAVISNKDRVLISNDEIYYYNASYESNSSNNDNNNGTNSDSGNQNTTTASDDAGYCTKLKEPLQFIGNIVFIFKILIPIIIIIFGTIDFFRAVIGAKDDEIKKSARSLLFRVLAGVAIFLIPTFVSLIFSLVSDFANIKGSFKYCQKCVLDVRNCK